MKTFINHIHIFKLLHLKQFTTDLESKDYNELLT